jgi:uncharacterized protein YbjQ (UPF0145 family)
MIRHDLTTSAFEIPGYRVKRSLGIVRGIVVRSRSVFGSNGVIAVRYDATEVKQGVTEVLCYGTAVDLEGIAH